MRNGEVHIIRSKKKVYTRKWSLTKSNGIYCKPQNSVLIAWIPSDEWSVAPRWSFQNGEKNNISSHLIAARMWFNWFINRSNLEDYEYLLRQSNYIITSVLFSAKFFFLIFSIHAISKAGMDRYRGSATQKKKKICRYKKTEEINKCTEWSW